MEQQNRRTARKTRDGAIDLRQRRAWFDDVSPTDTPPDKSGDKGDRTFSQDDVNKIAGQRAKEAKQAAINDLLKELGFEKADDLKALITAAKAKADAEKSELDKLNERLAVSERKAQAAEERAAAVEKQRVVDRRDAAVRLALKDALKPAAVWAWIEVEAKADLDATLADDGTIDNQKVEKLVARAKKELAELFKSSAPGSPSNLDGKAPQPDARKIVGGTIVKSL